jgi:DNA-binding FadR family transcriptional regulator
MSKASNNKITRQLRYRLLADGFQPGDRVWTFDQLIDEFGLSGPPACQRVLEPLITEGLLESRPGSGTFVLRLPKSAADPALFDLAEEAADELASASAKLARLRDLLGA